MNQGIILLGIKHCGKSTLGNLLSKQFHCPFFDTDDVITEMTGLSPRQIYQEQGPQAFMEAEAKEAVSMQGMSCGPDGCHIG